MIRQTNNEYSYSQGRAPIRPELLAAKLAAMRNYECPELLKEMTANPRLVELLWFLQAMSLRPGGLLKFVEDLLAEFPERVGTPTMVKAKSDNYSLTEKMAIFCEIPKRRRLSIDVELERDKVEAEILSDLTKEEVARMDAADLKALAAALKERDADTFRAICRREALDRLPEYFTTICIDKTKGRGLEGTYEDYAPNDAARDLLRNRIGNLDLHELSGQCWFFHDVMGAVAQFMHRMAGRVHKGLAMTEVAKLIFDRLDYALAEKVMVRIEGGSRFGKTEALSAWAEMRPGLARLVRVPSDNSMASFFKRIAEALGIDCSYGSNPSRLKERVEYIIQHSGLFLLFDEAHFLMPANFTATTPPHRLNWVRTEIVDRGLPLAISVTPQAFKGAIGRFVKKTGYDMTQFFGRDFLPCTLPEVLSEGDLIAVARIHFPTLSENALGYIANEARLSQNYLQAVEAIARRARFLASKRNGAINLKDLQTAVSEVLAGSPAGADQSEAELIKSEAATARPTKAAARRLGNGASMPIVRGIQPNRNGVGSNKVLDACSLRGAGPVMAETELVSVDT